MVLIKHPDSSITLKPQTALDHNFLIYLCEAIKARSEKLISGLGSVPASECQSHAQDIQPLIIGSEP